MATTFQKVVAVIVGAAFFMMIIGPIASLGTWLAGLVVAFIAVPVIVLLAMAWSRDRAEERGGVLLAHAGLTSEEWSERADPDDFEGEDD